MTMPQTRKSPRTNSLCLVQRRLPLGRNWQRWLAWYSVLKKWVERSSGLEKAHQKPYHICGNHSPRRWLREWLRQGTGIYELSKWTQKPPKLFACVLGRLGGSTFIHAPSKLRPEINIAPQSSQIWGICQDSSIMQTSRQRIFFGGPR